MDSKSGVSDYSVDENVERGNWGGKFEYLLSILGYAVGLGNVWRFPYLCFKNGGGAFFVPYVIILIFAGIPTFLLECTLGQYTSSGPTTCWECVPFFKGVGIAQVIISTYIGVYYNVIMAWSLYYLLSSFQSPLPWSNCNNVWNNNNCSRAINDMKAIDCKGRNYFISENVCYNSTSIVGVTNRTQFAKGSTLFTPAQQFWSFKVMGGDPHARPLTDAEKVGTALTIRGLDVELPILLAICWLLVLACMIRGIKSSGKVVYFTATFPYVILTILLVRALTLPGANDGLRYYLTPRVEYLLKTSAWLDAGGQIFFSLSCGQGGLVALSSYNRFHSPTLRDTLIVSIGNCLSSFYAGFVIFSFLGYSAGQRNMDVADAAQQGVTLAFQIYPEAVNTLPLPQLWSAIFFFMLLTLGMDSQFVFIEIFVTAVSDEFPSIRPHKWKIILLDCAVSFVAGLLYVSKGGEAWLDVIDSTSSSVAMLVVGVAESLAIGWIYGASNFLQDIGCMTGRKPNRVWGYAWKFTTPVLISGILLITIVKNVPKHLQSDVYPVWFTALEVLAALSALIWILVTGIILYFLKTDKRLSRTKRLRSLFRRSKYWGPYLPKHRKLIKHLPGFLVYPNNPTAEVNSVTKDDIPAPAENLQLGESDEVISSKEDEVEEGKQSGQDEGKSPADGQEEALA